MQQVIQLKISGLHTNSEYLNEVPEGALLKCENWNHDRNGMLQKRRGFFVYGDDLGISTDRAKQLLTYKGRVLRHFTTTLDYDDGSGTFTPWSGSYTEPDGDNLRMKYQEMNGNLYFTTDSGIKKLSASSVSDFADITPVSSGGINGLTFKVKPDYSISGFLSPLSKAAYRIVWAYKDKNNNVIRGRVSPFTIISNVSETDFSNVTLTFPIPDSIDDNYYYEIYRSREVTADSIDDFNDVSPEDELNLVAEAFPDLALTSVTITDSIVEDFRVGGVLLHTNVISGEGILSDNYAPPSATDITNYKNFMFYANTKSYHTVNLSLSSVVDLVSLSSKLIISNGTQTDEFTFVGETSSSTIEWGGASYSNKNLLRGKYFILSSASDEREYFAWFNDNNTAEQPSNTETEGALPIEINLKDLGGEITDITCVDDVAGSLNNKAFQFSDAANNYYTWYNNGTGVDPATTIPNLNTWIGVEVKYNDNDSDTVIASLTNDALQDVKTITSIVNGSIITITNHNAGNVVDAKNLINPNNPSFSYSVIRQGFHPTTQAIIDEVAKALTDNSDFIAARTGSSTILDITNCCNGNNEFFHIKNSTEAIPTAAEETTIQFISDINDSLNSKYFEFTAKGDATSYYVWYNNGGIDPALAGKTAIPVIYSTDDTAATIMTLTESAINSSVANVTTTNNGISKLTMTSVVPGTQNNTIDSGATQFTITTTIQGVAATTTAVVGGGTIVFTDQIIAGDGEDAALNHILLSSRPSRGQQVEQSAISTTFVNNSLSGGLTNATYTSGENDIVGQMNFQSRTLEDTPFFIAVENADGTDFSPHLQTVQDIDSFVPSPSSGDPTRVTTSGDHGYSDGDKIVIYNNVDINGVYTISNSEVGGQLDQFDITKDTFGLSSGTAKVFRGDLESDNEVSPNRIYYSKIQQPEAVPILNFIDVGPKDKEIKRIIALRDSLYIFKEDGVYRLTGESPTFFNVQLFDSSAIILSADSLAVLNNQIIFQSEQGIMSISDTGAVILSKHIENLVELTRLNTNSDKLSFGLANDTDSAYYFWTTEKTSDTNATVCFRYNSDTNSWSTNDLSKTCGVVSEDIIYLGSSDINNIEKERKNLDRTDHADREFTLQLGANGISGDIISGLSTLENVEVGDVIYQEQHLTIAEINRLLRKLDLDQQLLNDISSTTVGATTTIITSLPHNLNTDEYVTISNTTGNGANLVNGTHRITVTGASTFTIPVNTIIYTVTGGNYVYDYEENLSITAGASVENRLSLIAEKLQLFIPNAAVDTNNKTGFYGSGTSFCYDTSAAPTDSETSQPVFNLITTRLNELPDTSFTNYFSSTGTKKYEEVVLEKDVVADTVTVNTAPSYIVGDVIIYKGIVATVTWVPNHAGDPTLLKRFSRATVLFDTLNFTNSIIKFSSDASKSFEGATIDGEGVGLFGNLKFGNDGFGGSASSAPFSLMVPRDKARCRYISTQFINENAREELRVFGVSYTVEPTSERAYRRT